MPSPRNPEYDPDWAARVRAAIDAARRWQTEADTIAAAEGFGSHRHLAALAHQRDAAARHKLATRAQFHTIADYAASRFAALAPPRDGVDLVPDFDSFVSLQEVDAAASRAAIRRQEGAVLNAFLLPARQPEGLAAFAEPDRIITSWRRFGPPEAPRDCLVSFHETGGQFHVCLAHRWGALSRNSNEDFRRIATELARQAIIFAVPRAAFIFAEDRHLLAEHRTIIRDINEVAKKFRLYRHLWPHRALKEQFSRVEMGWDGARFIDPDWTAEVFGCLPPALRDITADFPESPALPAPDRSDT